MRPPFWLQDHHLATLAASRTPSIGNRYIMWLIDRALRRGRFSEADAALAQIVQLRAAIPADFMLAALTVTWSAAGLLPHQPALLSKTRQRLLDDGEDVGAILGRHAHPL